MELQFDKRVLNNEAGSDPRSDEAPRRSTAPRPSARGGRRRSAPATTQRPRRPSTRAARVDLEQSYLSEMAATAVLSAPQEVALAEEILAAERGVLAAIAASPTGARALQRLAGAIYRGELAGRDLLLNPDDKSLDVARAEARLKTALRAATSPKVREASAAVDTLAALRLDPVFVEEMATELHAAAAHDKPADGDVRGARACVDARRALREAKDRLVLGNLRLVVLFARRYLGHGITLLDLVQEGNVGLMRAADKFDHRRGFRFSTYASWWVKQALQRAMLDRSPRLPVHVADERRRVARFRATFLAQRAREPSVAEIVESTSLSPERVELMLALPPRATSLDAPAGEGDSSILDGLPSPIQAPDDAVAHRVLRGQVAEMLGSLAPREQEVLRMRFGIDDSREHTLEEIGAVLSLTRERIRQIERGALEKLRARSERLRLHSYLDG